VSQHYDVHKIYGGKLTTIVDYRSKLTRGDHMLDMGFSLEDASAATTTPSALALRKKRNDFKHALIVVLVSNL
jgi:hypothetical protein